MIHLEMGDIEKNGGISLNFQLKNLIQLRNMLSCLMINEIRNGRNVFTVTRGEAKTVAKAAGNNKTPIGPEIDKGKENTIGYYYHFHVAKKTKPGHVFFLFW